MEMQENEYFILCVDDDQDDLLMLQEAFEAMGSKYTIKMAIDGVDALEQLNEMKENNALPCLIILDINMPKMDGKQTLVAIQSDKQLASIPIVVFSTSSSKIDKMFFTSKCVEFITKPFDLQTFYNSASKMLNYCKV